MSGRINLVFDASLQTVFMLAFFTTVGLGASLKVLLTGGKLLFIYWFVNVLITVLQTGIGVFLDRFLDLTPRTVLSPILLHWLAGMEALPPMDRLWKPWGTPEPVWSVWLPLPLD